MAPQHCQTDPTELEAPQTRAHKIAKHRRYHPYRRNVTIKRTDDDNYRAIYESSVPILGMAKFPVQGVVEFRAQEQAPVREGRVERVFGVILRFILGLRRKAEGWLGLAPPQLGPVNNNGGI